MSRRRRGSNQSTAVEEALDPLRSFEGSKAEYYITAIFYKIRKHIKVTLIILGAIIVGIVATSVTMIVQENQEKESQLAFEKLLKQPFFKEGSGAERVALTKLDEYMKTNSSPHAVSRATLKKAEILQKLGEDLEAATSYREVANSQDSIALEILFRMKSAMLFESSEKFGDALDQYSLVVQKIPEDNFIRAQARFGEARSLLRLGRQRDADEAFRHLMEMKDADNIDRIRIVAAAYRLQYSPAR